MWESQNTYVFDIDPGSVQSILHTVPKIASFADKDWLYYFENGNSAAYYTEEGIEKAKASGLKDFLDTNFEKKYFSGIREVLKTASDFLKKLASTDKTKSQDKDLANLIERGAKINTDIFGYYLACQPQYVAGIEDHVQRLLSKTMPTDKVVETFTLLSTPTIPTSIKKEEIDWLELLLSAKVKTPKADADTENKIRSHLKKYYAVRVEEQWKLWDFEYLLSKFKEDIKTPKDELLSSLKTIKNFLGKIKTDQNKAIRKNKISKEIVYICGVLAEIGHCRFEMRVIGWMPIQYHLELLAKEAARRFSYNPEHIKFAQVSDVLGLFRGEPLDKEVLKERSGQFLYLIKDRKTYLYGGNEAKNKFHELVDQVDHSAIKEFGGKVAMKGKVIGTAVVFKWTDDLTEKMKLMREDSILIAGQTRPQLMPLISKSRAIVTDEGGITSHAAIVSRELGIPCVIGTRIATHVIKDGDLVEVDADNGIVKILIKKII
ncbi:MAG: PEP-utilizing enzyme [bacterium]|nr:PEP-utilizing enzyme [bacterium]